MRIEFKCYPQLEAILPKPVPAKRMTPEWLKSMPMVADDRDLGEENIAKITRGRRARGG